MGSTLTTYGRILHPLCAGRRGPSWITNQSGIPSDEYRNSVSVPEEDITAGTRKEIVRLSREAGRVMGCRATSGWI